MSRPRRIFPKAPAGAKKLPLTVWNDLLRSVEGLSGLPVEGYYAKDLVAPMPQGPTILRVVELDEPVGPDESSEFRDRQATVLYWDSVNSTWSRTDPAHEITVVTDAFDHLVLDEGQKLVVWYHAQSGKYVPINPHNMRVVKTCNDNGGYYPERDDCPNVYPIAHVTASFSIPSVGSFTSTISHVVMSSIDRLGTDPPHGGKTGAGDVLGYVYNLAGGGDDLSYIPVGTIVPAWMHNGQWWTYWIGKEECEVSSSMCSESTSSTTSSGMSSSCSESSLSTLSSSSSTGCSVSCSSSSSVLESASSSSASSSTMSSTSSRQLTHVRVVVDVCCEDDGEQYVVYQTMTFDPDGHLLYVSSKTPTGVCE